MGYGWCLFCINWDGYYWIATKPPNILNTHGRYLPFAIHPPRGCLWPCGKNVTPTLYIGNGKRSGQAIGNHCRGSSNTYQGELMRAVTGHRVKQVMKTPVGIKGAAGPGRSCQSRLLSLTVPQANLKNTLLGVVRMHHFGGPRLAIRTLA